MSIIFLRGFRCSAIIGVHFWPETVPTGVGFWLEAIGPFREDKEFVRFAFVSNFIRVFGYGGAIFNACKMVNVFDFDCSDEGLYAQLGFRNNRRESKRAEERIVNGKWGTSSVDAKPQGFATIQWKGFDGKIIKYIVSEILDEDIRRLREKIPAITSQSAVAILNAITYDVIYVLPFTRKRRR